MTTTTSEPASSVPAPRAGRKQWAGLAVLALPTLLISLDVSVLYLALPKISVDLRPSSTQTLWILDSYGFMVAGFLITMGSLGDRIGRRRLLLIGASSFAVLSVVAAFSTSPTMLIVARGLLGVAGATLMPSTLALISTMFENPIERGKAIAVWISCFMGGTILGPVIGGVLLEHFWWGSAFLLGVPAMVVLLIAGPILLPEHRNPDGGPLDLLSVVLSLGAILPFVYAIKDFAKSGVHTTNVAVLAVGLVVGALFVRRERMSEHPVVDISLFSNRRFVGLLSAVAVTCLVMGGVFYLVSQYVQLVLGNSPLKSGVLLVPASVVMIVVSMTAPGLAARIGRSRMIVGGLVLSGLGLALLTMVDTFDPALVVVAMSAIMAGMAPMASLGTDLILGTVGPDRAGQVVAMSETWNELSIALGVAVVGSIGAGVYRAGLPDTAPSVARDSLGGALKAAHQLPGSAGAHLADTARAAFTSGLHVGAWIGVALISVAAVLTLRLVHDDPAPVGAGGAGDAADGTQTDEADLTEAGGDLAEADVERELHPV